MGKFLLAKNNQADSRQIISAAWTKPMLAWVTQPLP
jgi:hypothetical protein